MNIFGGNTGVTYEQLQQRRKMAERLREQNSRVPRNVGEGIHAIARALVARGVDKQNTQRSREMRDQYGKIWESLAGVTGGAYAPLDGGGQGFGGTPPDMPATPEMPAGNLDMGRRAPVPRETRPAPNTPGMPAGDLDMGRPDMSRYREAIASIESAGSGDYRAVGPTHPTMGRALGRYQVMEANIPQWSREALGREVSADEFLASPEIQDAIFDHKFGGYVENFGEEGAAQAWFAGPGGVGKMGRKDSLGTSVADYTQKFSGALGGERPQGVRTAQAGGIDPSIAQLAQLLSAPDEFMPPGQKAVVQALLQRKLAQSDPSNQLDLEYKRARLDRLRNPERPTVKAADGYLYYADGDKERVFPNVQRPDDSPLVSIDQRGRQDFGPPPKDHVWLYDENGDVLMEPTPDGRGMRPVSTPIGGTPDARDAAEAAAEAEAADAKAKEKDRQAKAKLGTTITSLNLNLNNLENQGGVLDFDLPVTGAVGDARRTWLGQLLTGSEAVDFGNRTNQVTDSAAFAEIQNMRDNSPTGGAVGQLTDKEREAIGNAVTALNNSTSREEYMRAARAYRKLALDLAFKDGEGGVLPYEIDDYGNVTVDGEVWFEMDPGEVPYKSKPSSAKDNQSSDLDFSSMTIAEVGQVDIGSLTPEQMDALEKRMEELGL